MASNIIYSVYLEQQKYDFPAFSVLAEGEKMYWYLQMSGLIEEGKIRFSKDAPVAKAVKHFLRHREEINKTTGDDGTIKKVEEIMKRVRNDFSQKDLFEGAKYE